MTTENIPAVPANAVEASNRLGALSADKSWSDRLLAGDVAATREFHELTGMVAGGDKIDMALAGIVPGGDVPDADDRRLTETASMLREAGISDGVIREALIGEGVSQKEFDAVTIWKAQHMRDPEFTKNYLAGDPEAARLMTTANIVIANGVKAEGTTP